MQSQKISILAIEDLQKAMREAPEYSAKEVTKVQAVRLLAPQIQEMQSRGYSLGQIADFLSAKGFLIKPTALKNYLTKIKADTAKKTPRIPARTRTNDRTLPGASERSQDPSVGSERGAGSGETGEAGPGRPGEMKDRSMGPSSAGVRTSSGGPPLRSGSTPRKDSPDL
jgi:hypothetical protein